MLATSKLDRFWRVPQKFLSTGSYGRVWTCTRLLRQMALFTPISHHLPHPSFPKSAPLPVFCCRTRPALHYAACLPLLDMAVQRLCSFRGDASNPKCAVLAKTLRKKGHTLREIAKMLHIAVRSVERCLKPDAAKAEREARKAPAYPEAKSRWLKVLRHFVDAKDSNGIKMYPSCSQLSAQLVARRRKKPRGRVKTLTLMSSNNFIVERDAWHDEPRLAERFDLQIC
mgnify:CR=1 FL=1